MAAKKIDDAKALRIYGPYPDKRDSSKWTVHLFVPGEEKARIVPTSNFDLSPVYKLIQEVLFKNVVARAGESDD